MRDAMAGKTKDEGRKTERNEKLQIKRGEGIWRRRSQVRGATGKGEGQGRGRGLASVGSSGEMRDKKDRGATEWVRGRGEREKSCRRGGGGRGASGRGAD